jgi:hypothetical protein
MASYPADGFGGSTTIVLIVTFRGRADLKAHTASPIPPAGARAISVFLAFQARANQAKELSNQKKHRIESNPAQDREQSPARARVAAVPDRTYYCIDDQVRPAHAGDPEQSPASDGPSAGRAASRSWLVQTFRA